jgi:hypothetical protein
MSEERFIEAIRLFDLVLTSKDIKPPLQGWAHRLTGIEYLKVNDGKFATELCGPAIPIHPAHEAWDELYRFIFENFPIPAESGTDQFRVQLEHCKKIIDQTYRAPSDELLDMIRRIPPVLLEVILPVAMARYILRDAALPISHRQLKTFKTFHHWYGGLVLNC